MPRACPVEVHAGCYLPTQKTNSKQRETPPRKAVASSKVGCCSFLAANVNLPPDKPEASSNSFYTISTARGGTDLTGSSWFCTSEFRVGARRGLVACAPPVVPSPFTL